MSTGLVLWLVLSLLVSSIGKHRVCLDDRSIAILSLSARFGLIMIVVCLLAVPLSKPRLVDFPANER